MMAMTQGSPDRRTEAERDADYAAARPALQRAAAERLLAAVRAAVESAALGQPMMPHFLEAARIAAGRATEAWKTQNPEYALPEFFCAIERNRPHSFSITPSPAVIALILGQWESGKIEHEERTMREAVAEFIARQPQERFRQISDNIRAQLSPTSDRLSAQAIDYIVNAITNDMRQQRMFGNCIASFYVGLTPDNGGDWSYGVYQGVVNLRSGMVIHYTVCYE